MATRRRNDPPTSHSRFRTDRMVRDGSEWYFLTREATIEGPFRCQADAEEQLQIYIRMALHDMLPTSSTLALADQ